MELKLSKDLMRMVEERKKMELDRETSEQPRLIINMEKKKTNGFRIPNDHDLDDKYRETKREIDVNNISLEEIKQYVREHTSGKKNHYDLAEGGVMVVSFKEFIKMINDGYNIYKSEVINENNISIRYQREIKREGRGR